MLAPNKPRREMSPLRPLTKLDCSESSEKPPSSRTRPAPIVSGSSVTSGRCCAYAFPLIITQITKSIDFRFQILDLAVFIMLSPRSPAAPAVQKHCHRAIVDQLDGHVGLKLPCFHHHVAGAQRVNQS